MSILDQDLAFNFDYIRELQKVGIETMELAQETAREQEASMARLRGYLDELPPAIDTRDLRQLLDEYQGTMDCPLFEETKQYFKHRLTTLIERISQIDLESMKEFAELTDYSRQIAWQYEGLVHMVGKGSTSLSMTEFQAKLNQVMEAGENAVVRELIKVEDGAFVYQWEEISRLLEQKKVSDKELAALLEVLKLAQKEKEGKEELYQQWLEQIKQALPAMEPGSHTHLAKLLQQCKELADLGVISLAQYAELESQYLWYQLSKIEQMQAIYASEMEANKDWFMTTYRMTEEEFEDYKANVLVTVELWELYEKDINAYHEMSFSEQQNIARSPGADFVFLVQMGGFTTDQRLALLKGMQENGGILSDETYEAVVGEKDKHGFNMARIQITYNASSDETTFVELEKEVNRKAAEKRMQFAGMFLLSLTISGSNEAQNPAAYDGNLDPNYRLDQIELNSKNGFKNYDYVPLPQTTLDWLKENYPMPGDAKFVGPLVDKEVSEAIEGPGKLNEPIITKTHRGLEVEFVNSKGNQLSWVEPNSKSIPNAINNAQNSKNVGVAIEGKVANVVQQNTEVTGFGVKVKNTTLGKTATDIDVMTNTHIIEVKKSTSVIKLEQMDRLVNPSNPDFFNYSNKEVILYIDEAIDMSNPTIAAQINSIEQSGVTVVNSLEALAEVIK